MRKILLFDNVLHILIWYNFFSLWYTFIKTIISSLGDYSRQSNMVNLCSPSLARTMNIPASPSSSAPKTVPLNSLISPQRTGSSINNSYNNNNNNNNSYIMKYNNNYNNNNNYNKTNNDNSNNNNYDNNNNYEYSTNHRNKNSETSNDKNCFSPNIPKNHNINYDIDSNNQMLSTDVDKMASDYNDKTDPFQSNYQPKIPQYGTNNYQSPKGPFSSDNPSTDRKSTRLNSSHRR